MSKHSLIVTLGAVVMIGAGVAGWVWVQQHGGLVGTASSTLHTGTPYDAIAKLPDWSGAWEADAQPSVLQTDAAIPLTAPYAAQLSNLRASVKAGGALPGNPLCRPRGLPLFMSQSGPLYEFLFAPGHVFIDAGNQEKRDIATDGRPLTDPDFDSFNGASVGHWEGETFVIETIGILPTVELFPGIPNKGNLHVIERIHLTGPDKLQDDITLTSATAFTAPYSYSVTFTRHREWAVSDYVCITPSHAFYNVAGYKVSDDEQKASTMWKPPVRQLAQPAADAASRPGGTWESIAKLPNWLGPWAFDNHPNEVITKEYMPLTKPRHDYLLQLYQIYDAGGDLISDVYHCRPRGAAQEMKAAGNGFYLVYTPGQVTLEHNGGQTRRFYTDGRTHPAELEFSFNGHSVAHWEGDMLVVDTVGMRPDVQMAYGIPAGGQLHMVERIHLIAPDKLEIVTTQESPVALLAPWTYNRTFSRRPKWNMLEDYCSENNRDVNPDSGMQTFDLTPPPQ